jgi:hypothetical protein
MLTHAIARHDPFASWYGNYFCVAAGDSREENTQTKIGRSKDNQEMLNQKAKIVPFQVSLTRLKGSYNQDKWTNSWT